MICSAISPGPELNRRGSTMDRRSSFRFRPSDCFPSVRATNGFNNHQYVWRLDCSPLDCSPLDCFPIGTLQSVCSFGLWERERFGSDDREREVSKAPSHFSARQFLMIGGEGCMISFLPADVICKWSLMWSAHQLYIAYQLYKFCLFLWSLLNPFFVIASKKLTTLIWY